MRPSTLSVKEPNLLEDLGLKMTPIVIAVIGVFGTIFGIIGTLATAGIAAWARRKETEIDKLRTYLESGIDAHKLAAELSGDVYERVRVENKEDLRRLRADLDRVLSDNADLRQEMHFLEHELNKNEQKMRTLLRVLGENLSPDTLEILQSALDEESGAEDLSLELPDHDV